MQDVKLRNIKLGVSIILFMGISNCAWLSALLDSAPSRADAIQSLEEKMLNEKNPLIYMATSEGSMVLEVYSDRAPKTAANFIDLALGKKSFYDPKQKKQVKRPYFDDLIFHRVIPNFVIQGGDINGDGTGGPGYKFEDEIGAKSLGLDVLKIKDAPAYGNDAQKLAMQELNISSRSDYKKKKSQFDKKLASIQNMSVEDVLEKTGYKFNDKLESVKMIKFTLAMANSGPDTNGSQFFINLVDNPHLNGKHTVFGKLLKGRDVLEKIAKLPVKSDKPNKDVIIKKVVLIE